MKANEQMDITEQVSADLDRSYRLRRLGREIARLEDRLAVFRKMECSDFSDTIRGLEIDLASAQDDMNNLIADAVKPNEK